MNRKFRISIYPLIILAMVFMMSCEQPTSYSYDNTPEANADLIGHWDIITYSLWYDFNSDYTYSITQTNAPDEPSHYGTYRIVQGDEYPGIEITQEYPVPYNGILWYQLEFDVPEHGTDTLLMDPNWNNPGNWMTFYRVEE